MGEPKSLIPENVQSRFGRAVQQLNRETKKVFESLSPPARRALSSAKTDSGSSLEEMLAALRADDSEPFFRRLSVMPIILRWEEVYQLTVIKWWAQKATSGPTGQKARANLERIGKVLAHINGAPELPPNKRSCSKRAARSRSKATNHWFKKFLKWEDIFRDIDLATQQTLMNFASNSRLRDPARKAKVRKALCQKIHDYKRSKTD